MGVCRMRSQVPTASSKKVRFSSMRAREDSRRGATASSSDSTLSAKLGLRGGQVGEWGVGEGEVEGRWGEVGRGVGRVVGGGPWRPGEEAGEGRWVGGRSRLCSSEQQLQVLRGQQLPPPPPHRTPTPLGGSLPRPPHQHPPTPTCGVQRAAAAAPPGTTYLSAPPPDPSHQSAGT